MSARTCPCGAPIPADAHSLVRFCSARCRPAYARSATVITVKPAVYDAVVRAALAARCSVRAVVDDLIDSAIAAAMAQTSTPTQPERR